MSPFRLLRQISVNLASPEQNIEAIETYYNLETSFRNFDEMKVKIKQPLIFFLYKPTERSCFTSKERYWNK